MPWEKLNKEEMQLQIKPWITKGIIKSIKRRDKLFKKYIEASDPIQNYELHGEYKKLRNKIIDIIQRLSKKNTITKF